MALHVCRAYELGADAVVSGSGMKLLVAPPAAWVARTVVLPFFLASGGFPRGARAPAEVVPDAEEARGLTVAAAAARLANASDDAAGALLRAARTGARSRVTHAYFGPLTPLTPLTTLRLLSAHTLHHSRGLAAATARHP